MRRSKANRTYALTNLAKYVEREIRKKTGDAEAAAARTLVHPRLEREIIYTQSRFRGKTIRAKTKPSTAKCDLNTYTWFLRFRIKIPRMHT
jgi:hypothetical protein